MTPLPPYSLSFLSFFRANLLLFLLLLSFPSPTLVSYSQTILTPFTYDRPGTLPLPSLFPSPSLPPFLSRLSLHLAVDCNPSRKGGTITIPDLDSQPTIIRERRTTTLCREY